MLQPVRRRTWAPSGQTPIQKSWDRHERLSAISGITISPRRNRLGMPFRIYRHNIRFLEVLLFLKVIHHHLRRKFILILDRYSVHRKAVRLLGCKHPDWFAVEWLPPYAPDLNPAEQIWNHSKYSDLANFIPQHVEHLYKELTNSLWNQKHNTNLIRSFFKLAKLKL